VHSGRIGDERLSAIHLAIKVWALRQRRQRVRSVPWSVVPRPTTQADGHDGVTNQRNNFAVAHSVAAALSIACHVLNVVVEQT
jgi:hypothetical protein